MRVRHGVRRLHPGLVQQSSPRVTWYRFEGRASVRVSAEFDDDTASWFGEAASEPSVEKSPLASGSGNEPTW